MTCCTSPEAKTTSRETAESHLSDLWSCVRDVYIDEGNLRKG